MKYTKIEHQIPEDTAREESNLERPLRVTLKERDKNIIRCVGASVSGRWSITLDHVQKAWEESVQSKEA